MSLRRLPIHWHRLTPTDALLIVLVSFGVAGAVLLPLYYATTGGVTHVAYHPLNVLYASTTFVIGLVASLLGLGLASRC